MKGFVAKMRLLIMRAIMAAYWRRLAALRARTYYAMTAAGRGLPVEHAGADCIKRPYRYDSIMLDYLAHAEAATHARKR